MKKYLLALIVFVTFIECNSNRLKTDEKKLANQILTEEEQLAQQEAKCAEREKLLADSIAKLPKGFRFKEERKVDSQNLPLVIDIAGNLDNFKDIKLSAVASDIQYIRMETIPDSARSQGMRFKYYLMDNYLVGVNFFGIHLFSKDGKYIQTVVENEFTWLEYKKEDNRIIAWDDFTIVGGGTFLWTRGNHLFYPYTNNITGEKYIMEYDCSSNQQVAEETAFNPEKQQRIKGLGKIMIDLNHGQTVPPAPRKHQGMWISSPESMYKWLGTFAPDRNSYVVEMRGEHMLGILGTNGDTLATFSKQEQVRNHTKSTTRGTDYGTQYEKGGHLFVRTDFNDTIFQIIPPNRLLPVYVLNLGSYKATKQEGIDPEFNLIGKIIPQDFADTKDYLFFTFTKDSYDCPNTRKNKTLKLFHGIYSKRNKETFIIKSDPMDYKASLLQNDLDGGPSVWPTAYMIGKNGEILLSLKGSELKASVKSENFMTSTAPPDKKEKLKQLAVSVSDLDDILMIVQ